MSVRGGPAGFVDLCDPGKALTLVLDILADGGAEGVVVERQIRLSVTDGPAPY